MVVRLSLSSESDMHALSYLLPALSSCRLFTELSDFLPHLSALSCRKKCHAQPNKYTYL